nr:MAG TPA: hypothetical protein [Caudoviricetes sp.]
MLAVGFKSHLDDALARALYGRDARWRILDLANVYVVSVWMKSLNYYVERRYLKDEIDYYKEITVEEIVSEIVSAVERMVENGESKV